MRRTLTTRARAVVVACAALAFALAGLGNARAHATDPRTFAYAGASASLGAAHIYLGLRPVALFEWYAQEAGGSVEDDGTVASSGEPWVTAMYYPFTGSGYRTTFTTRPAKAVSIDPIRGGTISFSLPGVGSISIELKASSESPSTFPQGLTTPGAHHGHSWDLTTVLSQAKMSFVGGTIKKDGLTYQIRPLVIAGQRLAWVAESAAGRLVTR